MPEPKQEAPRDLTTRALALRLQSDGTPLTLDAEARSVEVVCSTESPVEVWDWERWEIVPEVLLMSGCQLPASRQVPLLNTHWRGDISSVLGSCRNLRVDGGDLLGRVHYSQTGAAAEEAFAKTREGHLTDYSIGYRVLESEYVKAGETKTIAGREFSGPVRVATQWKVRELSTCPIGADEMAKARAATQPDNPPHREENTMSDKEPKEEARAVAPKDPAPTVNPQPGLTEADVARKAEEMARAEIERREEIRAMCERFACPELAAELIKGGKALDAARKAVMDKHLASQPETPAFRAQVVADERDKFRSAAEDALLLRSGRTLDKPAAGALDLRGYSLREMARESLRVAGQPTGGQAMDMVGRAMTTGDFPLLLTNVANKSLFEGFEAAEETWQQWCGTGSVSDFKTHDLTMVSETDTLDQVPESTPYKYGDRSEAREQYRVATYGKLFAITRQAIINDDLGALTDIPRAHGEAAARTIGDVAYAVLIANAAMRDGVALFNAAHGNIGGAGVISEATIGSGIALMKLQRDLKNQRALNIRPQFFLAPVTIETASEVFFGSTQFAGANQAATRINPYAGTRFTRVYEPRLDGASLTQFYLAGPKGKTVTVFFLNGQQAPYLEARPGWSVDGGEYKVRIDCGAKAVDWKGLVRFPGV